MYCNFVIFLIVLFNFKIAVVWWYGSYFYSRTFWWSGGMDFNNLCSLDYFIVLRLKKK